MLDAMSGKSLLVAVAGAILGLTSAFSQSASNPETRRHLQQAQEYLKSGRTDQAIEEYRAALKVDPDNVTARSDLGTLLYFRGDFPKAAVELRAALKSDTSLWKTQTLLGMCEKRTGHVTAARADLEASFPRLQDEKVQFEAGTELMELYYASGELEKAANIVGVLHRLRPNDAGVLAKAYRIYSDQAAEAMLSVSMLAPKSAWMHELIAQEMVRQGNSEAAVEHYREALRMDARLPGLHFELAEVLSNSPSANDQQEAEKEYLSALAQNPFDEKSLCRLGSIALNRSNEKVAFDYYSRALGLQPEDAEANLGLGKTLLEMNQPERALQLIEKAVKLDPTDPAAHFRLGTLYRQIGRTDDARRELGEFQHLKEMKEQLGALYKEMRLPNKPASSETGLPSR